MIATIAVIAKKRVQRSQCSYGNALVCYCSDRSDCGRWDRNISISAIMAIAAIKLSQMAFISADMQIISIAEFWFLQRSLVFFFPRSQRQQRSWRSKRSYGNQALFLFPIYKWENIPKKKTAYSENYSWRNWPAILFTGNNSLINLNDVNVGGYQIRVKTAVGCLPKSIGSSRILCTSAVLGYLGEPLTKYKGRLLQQHQ